MNIGTKTVARGNVDTKGFGNNSTPTAGMNNKKVYPTTPPLPPNITILKYDPHTCQSTRLRWIIFIHSAPGNVERRRMVRKTWGNSYLFNDRRTAIVFLVGIPLSVNLQYIINGEFDKYGDIVQGDFIDTYKNLTLKAIMGLKLISEYCAHVPFAIKADDDAFVNIFLLMKLVPTSQLSQRFVTCFRWTNMPIYRPNSDITYKKWWLDDDVFPGKEYFPHYCAGIGYMISTKVMSELSMHSKATPLLWIDDVYITGLLMGKVVDLEYIDLCKTFNTLFMIESEKAQNMSQIVFSQEDPEELKVCGEMYCWKWTIHI